MAGRHESVHSLIQSTFPSSRNIKKGISVESQPYTRKVESKQSLRKFFILLITWFVTVVVIIAGSIIYDHYKSSDYDVIAGPYISRIIPEISKWDPATTRALMAPEISKTIPEESFTQVTASFSKLGALQSMQEPKFDELQVDTETNIGKQTLIAYDVDAKYEHGDAVIKLKLLLRDGSFEIYSFNFGSEQLVK